MLVLTDKLWEDSRIIKVHSSKTEDWGKPESSLITKCVLASIKEYMEQVQGGKRMIMIIDLSKGCFPPWMEALRIVHTIHSTMKKLIVTSLDFTVIYVTTGKQETWLNRLLILYKPARPVHIVHSKKEIKEVILANRKKKEEEEVCVQ